ncbi:recombinase RecT [Clostridium algidicarnis]|uniref:recombinase RecT n=1 Tax=Clostridium algidicarnis TaxID=37659 RepID=UPI001C0C5514|nr:recombinase RecT [Clostridium algidicarnis]MBU3226778.1 recombinase RecT [Clostridium algidicarnis]MBU3250311.1 recombinase RecT [Clostridium algidicarnis]
MENKAVATQERNITDKVLSRVKSLEGKGELKVPGNYSPENALKSAYLILSETIDRDKKPVLQSCSEASIANALLDMTIQGLSPSKKQCYFIPYGGKLQLSRSYLGTVAVTKRLKGVKNVVANVIYEGDEFAYELDLETGFKKITKHDQSFENIDPAKIKGAYAIVVMEDGQNYVEVMNIGQIKKSWNQGAAKGNSGAHLNFADEMAKKTVINRACKMFANTSDDSDLLIEAFNNSDEKTYDDKDLVSNVDYEVKEEIKEKANSKPIDIESPKVVVDVDPVEVKGDIPGQINIIDPGF